MNHFTNQIQLKMAAANRNQQMVIREDEEEEEEFEFHADVLESILSHVPLVDLVSASHVSKSWSYAVSSSLRHHSKPRPWLILHTQSRRNPYSAVAHAYDPRSDVWIKLSRPPMAYVSGLKSSNSNFLYMLSSSRFSFSSDPLNFEWHHVEPPLVWRQDPIVARVGDSVVIAGGGCDFTDEPMAVEIYDLNTRVWHYCDSMPGHIRDSSASSWLSVAVTDEKLVVAEKLSGEIYWFDPETKAWSKRFHLRTGEPVVSYNIGCASGSLILVGVCRIKEAERVKIWRVVGEDFECEEIGEMPWDYVEKLSSSGNCRIKIRAAGSIVYVYNERWEAEEVVACELVGGGCRWWSVRAPERRAEERLVLTCAEVGIDELGRVMRVGNGRLVEVSSLT